jgi:hypothetical protein
VLHLLNHPCINKLLEYIVLHLFKKERIAQAYLSKCSYEFGARWTFLIRAVQFYITELNKLVASLTSTFSLLN